MNKYQTAVKLYAQRLIQQLPPDEIASQYQQGPAAVRWFVGVSVARSVQDLDFETFQRHFGDEAYRHVVQSDVASACLSELSCSYGKPHITAIPETPTSLRVGICRELPSGDDRGDWPRIECPNSMPKSARQVVGLETGGDSPGRPSWGTVYHLSSNKSRKNWILWIDFEDDACGRRRRHPSAWCPQNQHSEHDAACYLLRSRWVFERDNWNSRHYPSVSDGGVLTMEEIESLCAEIWPEDVWPVMAKPRT